MTRPWRGHSLTRSPVPMMPNRPDDRLMETGACMRLQKAIVFSEWERMLGARRGAGDAARAEAISLLGGVREDEAHRRQLRVTGFTMRPRLSRVNAPSSGVTSHPSSCKRGLDALLLVVSRGSPRARMTGAWDAPRPGLHRRRSSTDRAPLCLGGQKGEGRITTVRADEVSRRHGERAA